MTDSTLPGSPELLRHETATGLLASTELARLADVAHDGTPRVVGVLDFQTRFPGARPQ